MASRAISQNEHQVSRWRVRMQIGTGVQTPPLVEKVSTTSRAATQSRGQLSFYLVYILVYPRQTHPSIKHGH